MATLQDIIAKRKELGAGATNVDARKALETVTPAPVNPVATTPTQPTPVAQPIVNAPVDQNTGLSKPLEQTQAPVDQTPVAPEPIVNNLDGTPVKSEVKPIEPVKTTVASKTEAPIDYTQAKGREAEITANLDSFKAKGMTPDEIMRASDYQNASPEKKAFIEPYLKQTVPTASAMYNAIVAKADIPEEQKLTPSYKIAQNRYTKANMFSGMTPSQLANEMKNVKLVEGSQAFEDLKAMNPKLVQDATNLRKVNGGTSNIFTYTNNADGTSTKVNNLEQTFADDFNDNFGDFIKSMYTVQTPEKIRAIIYTPDVQQAEEKAKSIELDINKIDDALDTVDKDVESELSGSGATGSRIALEKASRKDALNKQRDSLERNYTTYANKANNLITQNTSVYQTQQTQKNAQNAAMLPFITDQYKTEQAKRQAQEALNDPQTQIQATMNQFEDLGIVSQGDIGSKLQEFKDSGLTLPEYIKGLRKLYMEKPEYQQILAKQKGEGISYQTIGDKVYRQNADGSLTATDINPNKIETAKPTLQNFGTSDKPDYRQYNQSTGAWEPVSTGGYINVPRTGNNVGQDTNNPGNIMGDTQRQRDIATKLGAIGFYKSPNGRTYAVFPDMQSGVNASMSDLQSKLSGGSSWATPNTTLAKFASGWVSGPNAPINQNAVNNYVKLTGASANTPIKDIPLETLAKAVFANEGVDISKSANLSGISSSQSASTGELKSSDIEVFNSLTATDKKKLQNDPSYTNFQTTKANVMNDENANIFDVMKYSQGGKDMGEERLKSLGKFSQGLSQIADLSKAINEQTTGPILGTLRSYNPYDSNAQALVSQINSVVPNIARGVYGEVGVLTDADIQNYAKTLPNIRSTEDTNKLVLAMTLKTMLNGFKSQIQMDGAAGRDVSGFGGTVKQYETKINSLLNEINGKQSNTAPVDVAGQLKASNGKTYTF